MEQKILLNNKEYYLRTLSEKNENIQQFYSLFDNDLILHFTKSISALKVLYKLKIFTFKNFEEKYNYYFNGEKFLKVIKFCKFRYASNEHSRWFGASFRGKKRPEHSKHMKTKMKGIDRGDKFREIKKQQNKSINFKISFLKNKGYDLVNLNNTKILEIYSKYISDRNKNFEYRKRTLLKFLSNEKYKYHILFDKIKIIFEQEGITENNISFLSKIKNSIISTVAMSENPEMASSKYFKRGYIDVVQCLNKKTIYYKSSLELNFLNYLENNKLKYSYEPYEIIKNEIGIYKPDFLINHNGEEYLIELKGFVRGKEGQSNEQLKIKSALFFLKNKQTKYIYFRPKGRKVDYCFEELKKWQVTEENYKIFIKYILKWELE